MEMWQKWEKQIRLRYCINHEPQHLATCSTALLNPFSTFAIMWQIGGMAMQSNAKYLNNELRKPAERPEIENVL